MSHQYVQIPDFRIELSLPIERVGTGAKKSFSCGYCTFDLERSPRFIIPVFVDKGLDSSIASQIYLPHLLPSCGGASPKERGPICRDAASLVDLLPYPESHQCLERSRSLIGPYVANLTPAHQKSNTMTLAHALNRENRQPRESVNLARWTACIFS